ncbi:MAG: PilZ domain-containing protein [Planctomycetales bacterium]|nr:PilZ domain-containing protein [Planctomycetales bacterium]
MTSTQSIDPGVESLLHSADSYDGPERRASRRIPRTLEISVQPLDDKMIESGAPFFAITRDISQGGLAYLSSRRADFDKAVISVNQGIAPGIVCRICNSSVIHSCGLEEFCLTNVQFLHLYKRRKNVSSK